MNVGARVARERHCQTHELFARQSKPLPAPNPLFPNPHPHGTPLQSLPPPPLHSEEKGENGGATQGRCQRTRLKNRGGHRNLLVMFILEARRDYATTESVFVGASCHQLALFARELGGPCVYPRRKHTRSAVILPRKSGAAMHSAPRWSRGLLSVSYCSPPNHVAQRKKHSTKAERKQVQNMQYSSSPELMRVERQQERTTLC